MRTSPTERLSVTPWFDMELFMLTSQETRMGGEVMERLMTRFKEWTPSLFAHKLSADGREYLLVHLDETVESAVDALWQASPSEAFRLNALAQTLCMTVVHDLVPDVQDAGCAPAPAPTPALAKALADLGVPYSNDGPTLSRRFAVLTAMPFKGGCETCSLLRNCPKGQGTPNGSCSSGDVKSIVLPGHEGE